MTFLRLGTVCFPWQMGSEEEGGAFFKRSGFLVFQYTAVFHYCVYFLSYMLVVSFFLIVPITKYQFISKSVQQYV